jgi:crotonobetainyl-CoA:carnitine CoA-transferase CaiB-like acyl-CoA transferase
MPYGVYRTSDGWLALAMTPTEKLGPLLDLDLARFDPFADRNTAKAMIANRLSGEATEHWMTILRAADIWCAPVLDWPQMLREQAFQRLDMLQTLRRDDVAITTTRTPLRIDGQRAVDEIPAPRVGEHSQAIISEFALDA